MAYRRGVLVCLLGALAWPALTAVAAPVLRAAEVRVEFQSSTECLVELTVNVEGAAQVEHRVQVVDGARVELTEIRGGVQLGDARAHGRTRALVVRPEGATYTLSYAVEQPPSSAGRCPLWIPSVSADGRSQAVMLRVRIPTGATPAGTMPGLAWVGHEGSATLRHLPAFVRVPFAMPGEPMPLSIAFVMDVVAVATLVVASAAWARRNRGLAR
jgi:hypothetical protein